MHEKDCPGKKENSLYALFSSTRDPAVPGLDLSGGKTSTCTAHAQLREHAQCVRTHLLLRMRLGAHTPSWAPSVRTFGPAETGVLIQSRFLLATWDSPGRFTDLSSLEVKCACVWGGASEFRAGRAVPSGAFEEEGPRGHHLSSHRCRDTLVLVLVAGEEGWWAEESTGSDDSGGRGGDLGVLFEISGSLRPGNWRQSTESGAGSGTWAGGRVGD